MAEPAARRMSLAEFLEWDEDTRYELIEGRPRAIAPPIEAHGTIVANLAAIIRPGLKPPCRVVVEAGIIPADRADTWYQADLVVTCAPAERGARAIAEPRLTSRCSRRQTRPPTAASSSPTIGGSPRLIASEDRHVEVWRRAEDGWKVQDLIGDAALPLALDGRPLPLAAIYDAVAL